jgi:hypothetical protein
MVPDAMAREVRDRPPPSVEEHLIVAQRIDLAVHEVPIINRGIRVPRTCSPPTARKDHALQEPIAIGD